MVIIMSNQKEFREVMKLVFSGVLRPVIDKKFQLEDIIDAENYLNESKQFGKVIVEIS